MVDQKAQKRLAQFHADLARCDFLLVILIALVVGTGLGFAWVGAH